VKNYFFLVFLPVSVLLSSCSFPHFFYSPNVQNVPLFSESNEFSGYVAGSFGVVNTSLEIQAGYSLPAHLALTANFMTGGKDNSSASFEDYSKNNYFEGTLGYYKPFKNIGVFEIYGGYGRDFQQHAFTHAENNGWFSWTTVPDGSANLSFYKIFVQPDIGIKTDRIEGTISCRLSVLNFNEIEINNTVYHLEELNLLKQNSTPWLLEPAITFRGGSKSVKGQIQVVVTKNLTNSSMNFESIRFNFGLFFCLSNKRPEN
jgi:hypothetical protein